MFTALFATLTPYLLPAAGTLLAAGLGWLISRTNKALNVSIDQNLANVLAAKIIDTIVLVESQKPGLNGDEKKALAVKTVTGLLTASEQAFLEKRFGSIGVAVQDAFEKSSLAGKSGAMQALLVKMMQKPDPVSVTAATATEG